jgi:ligand-binding sensor domain-containing protein
VFEGSDGVIWIGGSGGLSRFEGGRIATVSQRNGLPGNQVSLQDVSADALGMPAEALE